MRSSAGGVAAAIGGAFLGEAPRWYKLSIVAFLVLNPIVLLVAGPFIAGWLFLLEFIFTLALALKCYPLQPGGLLALEAVIMGLTTPATVYREVEANFPILLLLMFMVAGIYFLRDLIIFFFTRLFVAVESKIVLSFLFCLSAAVLSAFLDALTVIAVVITVATGLHGLHHRAATVGAGMDDATRTAVQDQFSAFLRSLVMHAAVGTALGGVCTLVGEPQNLLVGKAVGWDFATFALKVSPVSFPVLAAGLALCMLLEKMRVFGYGATLPDSVRTLLRDHVRIEGERHNTARNVRLVIQAIAALILVGALAFHVAEVGLIGLTVIILATAFCGVVEEAKIGKAFEEALPFTALLVTFFAVIATIHDQHLFRPLIEHVLQQDGRAQLVWMYIANGVLSSISDNVFVATIYITEVKSAFERGEIDRAQLDLLAVAINAGTNIPSVATPNGQAAFLFLLTSALARLIRLGYMEMLWMALPYTIVMSSVGLLAVAVWLK